MTPEEEIALYEASLLNPGTLTLAKIQWAARVMDAMPEPEPYDWRGHMERLGLDLTLWDCGYYDAADDA